MEEKMDNGKTNLYHPNNFKCKTYWNYTENNTVEEPEQKTAQYEIDVKDEGYGRKCCVRIFSRVGTDPMHKRDYYTYLEFPFNSTFAKSLGEFLNENRKDLTESKH